MKAGRAEQTAGLMGAAVEGVQRAVQLSVLSSRWSLSEPDAAQEGGVVGHVYERVLVGDAYGDLLARAEQAHPSRVAGVELALARLDAARAAQEWVRVHHHVVAGDVREVEVVHLDAEFRGRRHKIHMRLRGVIKTRAHNHLRVCLKLKQLQYESS